MPVISPRIRLRPSKKGIKAFAPVGATIDRLSDLPAIGNNPGNLRGRSYAPKGLKGPAPLVVVLHGCTQNASVYDHGSGWSTLADRHGFVLLFPEQQRANNSMLCFNWFSSDHTQRGMGEAASIRSMIEEMKRTHAIDPARIFVTGLSAGGAMASVMLATYPEVFAGGAILAGLPYGCASDVTEAFQCMGGRARCHAAELGLKVRRASPHVGPWPRVQVWQGGADHTVVPANADAIVQQWVNVHGLGPEPDREDEVAGYPRRAWFGGAGTPVIEQYAITGMANGVPLASGGEDPLGSAGAHMLDVVLSSTLRIAAFFGIAPEEQKTSVAPSATATLPLPPSIGSSAFGNGPKQIIEKALKAAGLMR